MSTPSITAIIVTYKSDEVLGPCLESLGDLPTIVVDNGGTTPRDGVTFLKNRKNLGFGRANNRALKKVHTEYVLLMNPDAVLQEHALQRMLKTLSAHPKAGLVAPLLLDEDGNHRRSWRPKMKETPQQSFAADHIPAAIWLMRTETLRQMGGFDKRFFLFFEDTDLCLRLRKAGHELILEPAAQAMHLQGKSSTPSPRTQWIKHLHTSHSDILFHRIHHGRFAAMLRACRILVNQLSKLLIALITFNKTKAYAAIVRIAGILPLSPRERG